MTACHSNETLYVTVAYHYFGRKAYEIILSLCTRMPPEPARSTRPDRSENRAPLTNVVTVVGQGVASSYEITVDGEIEGSAGEETATVSGTAAEGVVDVGVDRFRFAGDLATVTFVGREGPVEPGSPYVPRVSVEYNVHAADR